MPAQIIPLDNSPNQSFNIPLSIDGTSKPFRFSLRYNEIAGYWVLTLFDGNGNLLLDSVPGVTATGPGENLMGQFSYLKSGSAVIVNASGIKEDHPDDTNLGTDFQLIWDDTPTSPEFVPTQ